jgi:hypothetical protein
VVQIGDPGYVTYSSLFAEDDDGLSSSDGRDLGFGYNNRRRAMSTRQIEQSIAEHAAAASRRVWPVPTASRSLPARAT